MMHSLSIASTKSSDVRAIAQSADDVKNSITISLEGDVNGKVYREIYQEAFTLGRL